MCNIFGVEIYTGSRERILAGCAEMIGKGGAISTVNPQILRASVYDFDLRRALSSSLNVPDGIGVRAALCRKGVHTDIFPGVELGEALLDAGCARFGIIGGASGVAERAVARLNMRHPSAEGVLALEGYEITDSAAASAIKAAAPSLVMVCMGSPKQELFIERMRRQTDGVLYIALGGSADIYSGDKKRAPKLARRLGAEWLYRMIREPERLLRAPQLLDFCFLSLIEPNVCRKIDKS